MLPKPLLAVVACAASVSAHGYVEKITINGDSYVGYNPAIAPWVPVQDSIGWENWATDLGYVPSSTLQSPDIVCHLNSTNGIETAPIAAGDSIDLKWTGWAESHHGPVMDYLANCGGDCTTVDKTTLEWFKIDELGQLELGPGGGKPGVWATDKLFDTNYTWTVNIPATIKPGNYVLRHELVGLHGAYDEGGAQFYPQCVNLEISGDGTETPKGTVGTKLYKSDDPGVLYDIYGDQNKPTYIIPGPPLYNA
ncbi:hypothetical protein FQN54_005049 [Arachnomyces sp. PD_36]|nr:hypothetical protein FQN54_005049 [Arachnomyces sp. PD_36]